MKQIFRAGFLAAALSSNLGGSALAQDRILISSDWGKVFAELADKELARFV